MQETLKVKAREGEEGSLENPIVDSDMNTQEALRVNPDFFMPKEVFERQRVVTVTYLSFDQKYHRGQIVVDQELEEDVVAFFQFLIEQKFPIEKAIPLAHTDFNFSDALSMAANNSSGFNPRSITGDPTRPSNHAFGRAIDINPKQNPYIKNEKSEPAGASYEKDKAGTFAPDSPIVLFLKNRGWKWGGDYNDLKDYHHFEKPLPRTE
jgi:peptidoglycan LD-endopeptidase CwlK